MSRRQLAYLLGISAALNKRVDRSSILHSHLTTPSIPSTCRKPRPSHFGHVFEFSVDMELNVSCRFQGRRCATNRHRVQELYINIPRSPFSDRILVHLAKCRTLGCFFLRSSGKTAAAIFDCFRGGRHTGRILEKSQKISPPKGLKTSSLR